MDYPNRLEWQTRCEFNAYCKRTLRNELIDACRESRSRQKHEVNFSDLAPHEEKQLYTVDRYFVFIPLTDILSMRTRTLFVQAV